jgi:vacuolar iron transporter family protein
MLLIPGAPRAGVTFVIVLLALALTGWVSARISDVRSARPILRMVGIGVLAMLVTYAAGLVLYPW